MHILAGLKDLNASDVKSPVNKHSSCIDHQNTLVATLKLLGEICMEETPAKHRQALAAFTSAIPGLPKFANVLLGVSGEEPGPTCPKGLQADGTLSDDVSEALMHVRN